jgi:hypothetical protein
MKGAMAEAPPKTIKMPKSSNKKIVGNNHHFLRATINFQMSVKKSMVFGFKLI